MSKLKFYAGGEHGQQPDQFTPTERQIAIIKRSTYHKA